jgi:hypothetical protein
MKLSDQYLWSYSAGALKKSSIFNGVWLFPHWPIKPAGSRTGTIANTNLTAAHYVVWIHKFRVLNKQQQASAEVVCFEQQRVPHPWLQSIGPGDYDIRASDLYYHSFGAQMQILHGLMSQRNITTSICYWKIQSCDDHTKWLTENEDTVQSDELSS